MNQIKPFIYVALDYEGQNKNIEYARALVESVDSDRYGFKINLDGVADFSKSALNPHDFVKTIQDLGKRVFVDLKMWNGGRTMEQIARGCADMGVDIINMYSQAGPKFIQKVAHALEGSKTKLFTLTVLTHYTEKDTEREYSLSLGDAVEKFARAGYENGARGIIVPGTQLARVRSVPVEKLCPAIRPDWYADTKDNAQEETITHIDAIREGADYLVVGSPIRKSASPSAALERILKETQN